MQITTYNNHTMKDKWPTQTFNSFTLRFPTKPPRKYGFECWSWTKCFESLWKVAWGQGKACIPLISWTLASLRLLRSFLSLSLCFFLPPSAQKQLESNIHCNWSFWVFIGYWMCLQWCKAKNISISLEGHSYEIINQWVLMTAQLLTGT